jgi:acetyl esterase/lipase
MKKIMLLLFVALLITSCSNNDEIITDIAPPVSTIPTVSSDAVFDVNRIADIPYAEGLSHESINSSNSQSIPLLLDVYVPDNDSNNRPVFMFIHGGGFINGNKEVLPAVTLANYYTSRGFVFVSINYRLLNDFGTVPQAWNAYAPLLDPAVAPQYLAIYPAQRDAKAALRWVVANADTYGINTDYITVGGGSAGAITAITLGVSELGDFTNEIGLDMDPSLSTTNLDRAYEIKTIIDFWGSKAALDSYEQVYGPNRFDANDPALFIVHGTLDPTVSYSNATDLQSIYEANNVPYVLHTLEGAGHAAWNAVVNGKRLEQLSFEFVTQQQGLTLD